MLRRSQVRNTLGLGEHPSDWLQKVINFLPMGSHTCNVTYTVYHVDITFSVQYVSHTYIYIYTVHVM